jgi:hypothetical protein
MPPSTQPLDWFMGKQQYHLVGLLSTKQHATWLDLQENVEHINIQTTWVGFTGDKQIN